MKLYHLHFLLPQGADFTLIKSGLMDTVYGTFLWDEKSAEAVSKAWAKRKRRFMWDYQHLSDKDGRPGPDGKPTPMASVHDRRAAGSSDQEATPEGFRLRDHSWTPDAQKYIADGEYIYYSPVIAVDERVKPYPRIVDVLKSSLTNDPATLGCPPVMLSDDGSVEEMTLPEQLAQTPEMQAIATTLQTGLHVPDLGTETPTMNLAGAVSHAIDAFPKDDSLAYDSSAACKRVWAWAGDDFAKARDAFGVVLGDGSSRDDYQLIHHDVKDGALVTVRGGVLDAINCLKWCALPAEYLTAVREHLQAEAERFGDRAPWLELSAPPAHDPAEAHPHGSAPKHNVASVLVHRESDGKSLWGRRADSKKYTSPGGRVKARSDKPERPVEAAARELREEAGISLEPHQLSYMGTVRCATPEGSPIDVHGYRCAVPDHVRPHSENDPDKEVGEWEWLSEHPLAEMHAPRNALSVLSARHEHLNLVPKSAAEAPKEAAVKEAGRVKQLDSSGKTMTQNLPAHAKVIDSMNIEKARALCLSLLGGLPSLSGEGVASGVTTAAQSAIASLKALDEQLAAAGATGEGVSVEAALSLSAVVMEVTGSKSLEGINGKVYSLVERANVAPVALSLSTEQAKSLLIDKAFRNGRISAKTRGEHLNRLVNLSVADCEHIASGPKLYDVPNTEPAPAGANGTKVSLTDEGVKGKGPEGPITAKPPESEPKTVQLSAAEEQLIRDIEREMPAGQKVNREAYAKVLASTARPAEQPRMQKSDK